MWVKEHFNILLVEVKIITTFERNFSSIIFYSDIVSCGLNNGPKKTCYPEPQNMTLFGIRVFADVVKIMILRSITGVFIRERRERFETQKGRPCEWRGRE